MDVIPYHEYQEQPGTSGVKNTASCQRLAKILDGEVLSRDTTSCNNAVLFPFDPLSPSIFEEYAKKSDKLSVYGSIAPHKNMTDKAMLHKLVSPTSQHPAWYNPLFSDKCARAVLPGYTIFNYSDLKESISLLKESGHETLLLKNPSASRGTGQIPIDASRPSLTPYYSLGGNIHESGLVIEPLLRPERMHAYSLGTAAIGTYTVSWIGETWTTWCEPSREYLFGGNRMKAVTGSLDDLAKRTDDPVAQEAIQKAKTIHDLYPEIGVQVFRATYDVLLEEGDSPIMGVVDPSLRPSASTPGEIVALEHMIQNDTDMVDLELRYIRPQAGQAILHPDEQVYAASDKITITTRVL